jgi:hypothetical protein
MLLLQVVNTGFAGVQQHVILVADQMIFTQTWEPCTWLASIPLETIGRAYLVKHAR